MLASLQEKHPVRAGATTMSASNFHTQNVNGLHLLRSWLLQVLVNPAVYSCSGCLHLYTAVQAL